MITCSVETCGRAAASRGLCRNHYHRLRVHGDPLGGRTFHGELRAWIESHVNFDGDECLVWPFARRGHGYGEITIGGKPVGVHRLMCERAHGAPPTAKHQAAHSCGRGHEGCVNPRHLRWATFVENEADKLLHGTRRLGERHPMVKLNVATVLLIQSQLAAGQRQADVASLFGVNRSTIHLIAKGKNWRSLVSLAGRLSLWKRR